MTGRRAVLLDRDGTIVPDVGYATQASQLRLLPGAGRALARLQERGYALAIVTNQSAVARGLLTEEELERIHADLRRRLRRHQVELAGFFHCPHLPSGRIRRYRKRCRCRKPAPGLIRKAIRELELDPDRTWMIGDGTRDVEAAVRAGIRPIQVVTGHGREQQAETHHLHPSVPIVDDLSAAVDYVLRADRE